MHLSSRLAFSSLLALGLAATVVTACSSAGSTTGDQTNPGSGGSSAGAGGSEGGGTDGGAGTINVAGSGGSAGTIGVGGNTNPNPTDCQTALGQPSNVGCEFWAVDLDNEPATGLSPNSAASPWALVLSNTGTLPAEVTIEQNDAPVGQPAQIKVFKTLTLAPGQLANQLMPSREVDGSVKPGEGVPPGTWLSSNAFRIRSTAPIVVYQFNTATNSFSNDASLLLPTNALGTQYRVLGWPTANPIEIALPGVPDIPSIPDHTYITVVGVVPDTHVKIQPTWRVQAGGPIALTQPGQVIEATLQPFDVLNLESDGATNQELVGGKPLCDFTGSAVQSDRPVAVFTGNERASASGGPEFNPPDMQPGDTGCCTDHLEEQLFPLSSIGRKFIVTRSPIRSKGGFKEPDVLRFMGAAATTEVTTSLPAPHDKFTLKPGETHQVSVVDDVIVTATEPVVIGQILVSQSYCNGTLTGDPSLTIYAPTEQYRQDYLFLVPNSWDSNYVVISAPVGATISIDDTTPGCEVTAIGQLDGVEYESRRCAVGEGTHTMAGDKPFGIVAYGYGSAGSYAFVGGADVRPIYQPPPIIN